MKYLLFSIISIFGVPLMTLAAVSSERIWKLLIVFLVFSTALGDMANINFLSMEYYRGPDRGFEVNLTDLICVALILTLIFKHHTELKLWPKNTGIMFLIFTISIVSIMNANQPILSLFTLFKMAKFYLLFWCLSNHIHCGKGQNEVIAGFILSGLFVTALAVQQKYLHGIYRVHGPFDHSNTIPLYLNMFAPILLAWLMTTANIQRWQLLLGLLSVLGMTFAVVATFSRAGTALNVLAMISVIAYVMFRKRGIRVSVISGLFMAALILGGSLAADSIINRIKNAPVESEQARDEFNEIARLMAEDNIFGVGLNHFSHQLTNTDKYRENLDVMSNEEQGGVAHHIYLLTAAELGYIGLVSFVILLLRFHFIAFWNSFNKKEDVGAIFFAILVGLTSLHASGFLEWAFRITPVTYMFAITAALLTGMNSTNVLLETTTRTEYQPVNNRYIKRSMLPIR
jgi:O-antigen ligase